MDEQKFIEMYSDIKVIVSELKTMNGCIREARCVVDKHIDESAPYRKKIDEVWAGIHFAKWIILLLFGTGLLFNIVKWVFK